MSIVYTSLNHPERAKLAAEVHSRPVLHLEAPETLTHFAVHDQADASRHAVIRHALLADLCARFGVTAPDIEAKHFFYDFGHFRLKWEGHTEFATYTFAQRHETALSTEEAFAATPLAQVPQDWLRVLQGKVLVAAHVVLECASAGHNDESIRHMQHVFEGKHLSSSKAAQGGEIWTDFLIQADGFSRFVVREIGLRDMQGGQLVQRILDIETYRMMALLGLPYAQQALPLLSIIESDLVTLTTTVVDADHGVGNPDEDELNLEKITSLAARIEKISQENSYRFSASQAYFRLVKARIEELRENRMEGVPTIGEFMERRLTPAMDTCISVARRQETLADRIAHTNDLLRTRVGIVQEQQNRQILESMNARAEQQLRLQQAVEGLSVAAISYYMVGLFGYVGKALKAVGLPVDPDIVTGLMLPVIAVGVWMGLRRLHKKMHDS